MIPPINKLFINDNNRDKDQICSFFLFNVLSWIDILFFSNIPIYFSPFSVKWIRGYKLDEDFKYSWLVLSLFLIKDLMGFS